MSRQSQWRMRRTVAVVVGFVGRFWILNDSEKWQELRGKLGTSFGLLHNEARSAIWIADRKLLVEGCLMTRWSTVSAALRHPSVLCVHRRVSRKSEGKLHASFQHLQLVMSGRRVGWLGTTRGAELSIKWLKHFEKPSWMAGVWWAACCNLAVLCEALKREHWIK